ncbi:hypothetical protein [Kamptonema formosum]|uniref:hypothetical protein n=1 Tax=Kamptonema formosum TaxID=331992 RepID=UPI000344C2D6|nr:hypothetical protein [Oscillatoria sp. PCC 10802]
MSSHLDQIQALISDIDGALAAPAPRLPWMGDTANFRRLLTRIRNYLVWLEGQVSADESFLQPKTNQNLRGAAIEQGTAVPSLETPVWAGQLLQAVASEMASVRSALAQPLQADLAALHQQRDALFKEIRQLEAQRQHQYSLVQQQASQQQIISEFLQALMGRLQESLTEQVAQTLGHLEQQFLSGYESRPLGQSQLEGAGYSTSTPSLQFASASRQMHPQERLERMRLLQQKSDELLLTLDSTLKVMFEALLRNIHSYEKSLARGLDKSFNPVPGIQLAEISPPPAPEFIIPETDRSESRKNLPPAAAGETHDPESSVKSSRRAGAAKLKQPISGQPAPQSKRQQQAAANRTQATGTGASDRQTPEKPSTEAAATVTPPQQESAPKVAGVGQADAAEMETAEIETLLNLDVGATAAPAPPELAPDEDLNAVLDLLNAERNPPSEPAEASSIPARLSAGGASADVSPDLHELYASLFAAEDAPATTAPAGQTATGSPEVLFEEVLFEGFADTAAVAPQEPQEEQSVASVTPSLEAFLFDEDSYGSIRTGSLRVADLFRETAAEPEESSTKESVSQVPNALRDRPGASSTGSEDDISLSELFGEPEAGESSQHLAFSPQAGAATDKYGAKGGEDRNQTAAALTWETDSYIPASPDEDLLPTVEEGEGSRLPAFWIDDSTLEQLREDLSFEPRSGDSAGRTVSPPVAESTAQSAPTESGAEDWLAELCGESSHLASATPEPEPPPLGDTPTMTLEEAFASLTEATAPPLPAAISPSDMELAMGDSEQAARKGQRAPGPAQGPARGFNSWEEADSQDVLDWEAGGESPARGRDVSALDDLFASLTGEEPSPSEFEGVDLFEPSGGTLDADATGDMRATDLDDLFAGFGEDTPTLGEPWAQQPFKPPAPDSGTEEKKKDLGAAELLAFLEPATAAPALGRHEDTAGIRQKASSAAGGKTPGQASGRSGAPSLVPSESETGAALDRAQSQGKSGSGSPQGVPSEGSPSEKVWYLGIDFGSTGISAALLNRQTLQVYPIYWVEGEQPESGKPQERSFRLPCVASLSGAGGEWSVAEAGRATGTGPQEKPGLLLQNFKPYLKVAIAGTSAGAGAEAESGPNPWEPWVQWSDRHLIPVSCLTDAARALLATLKPGSSVAGGSGRFERKSPMSAGAAGLEPAAFSNAMGSLAAAILSCNVSWPDSYSFNLREAVLAARLVGRAEQIVFVEDALAAVLSVLGGASGETVTVSGNSSQKLHLFKADWLGVTLAISAGAAATELCLVNLPDNLQNLSHESFRCHSFPYAGDAMDLDIICQLLLGEKGKSLAPLKALPAEELPRPGEPDLQKRYRLQQLLRSSSQGQALLEAAKHLKLILQHQERFTLELGSQRWVCTRRDLESRVFVPFVQRLNRELNALLSHTGVPVQAIDQALCTGGTATLPAIARWLRQKLPNATIIQDTYASDRPPACSRVAYGLATLPLHPQVFDVKSLHYSDCFLLLELLRCCPDRPLSVAEIVRLLELRGINTGICFDRILAVLEGDLPVWIRPDPALALLLTPEFRENADVLGLHAAPLFYKQDDSTYRPNVEQCQRLRHYLSQLMAGTSQKLDEPLTVDLV